MVGLTTFVLAAWMGFSGGDFKKATVKDVQMVPAAALRPADQSNENYDIMLESDGMAYTCRYVKHFVSNLASKLVVGSDVQLRLDGSHGYIQSTGEKEIKCSIVRRERLSQ